MFVNTEKARKGSTDLGTLEKQYRLLRQRQKQAAVIVQSIKDITIVSITVY